MAILVFEHHPQENPARVGATLRDHGHRLRIVKLHAGMPLPADLDDVDAILSLGGPMNVDEADQHPWMQPEMAFLREAHERHIPVVGICLGAQMLATALGGQVSAMPAPEAGWHRVRLAFPGTIDPLLSGIPWTAMQFHIHGQEVTKLPDGATPLASSAVTRTQAFKVGQSSYGFQYHFEWNLAELNAVIDHHSEWLGKARIDVAKIHQESEQHYDMYRHLGDRLAHNIANLLVPIDKRLGGARGKLEMNPVKNWQADKS